jgi:lysozyme
MIKYPRSTIAALTLSAAGFASVVLHEGWSNNAIIPVPGDVPTIGFGSTVHEDGTPVRMGEAIAPPKAVRLSVSHIAKDETKLRKCLGDDVQLYQHEWDAYVSFAYNVGVGNFCNSSIPAKVRAGQYAEACKVMGQYVCGPATQATRAKPGQKCYHPTRPLRVLQGLVNRRGEEVATCLGDEPK